MFLTFLLVVRLTIKTLTYSSKQKEQVVIYLKKENAAAVKQSIKTLLLTNRLEKPFNNDFGGDIQGRLFGLAIDSTASEIKDQYYLPLRSTNPVQKY